MINTDGKTVQQVITEVLEKFIDQGKRCTRGGNCVYGDDQGNHCAIGWLLPDDREDLMKFEGSLSSLVTEVDDLGPNDVFIQNHFGVLNVLQLFHDSPRFPRAAPLLKLGVDPELIDKTYKILHGAQ